VDTTRAFTDGIVKNFAIRDALTGNKNPAGNDRDQAKAVYAGTGDVAIMNTYYLGRMLYSSDPLEQAVAETVRVFFPNQDTYGTHVNVSGVGLSRYAKNKENALRLVDFLLLDSSQRSFANSNFEYPINPLLDPHPLLASWGTFKEQEVSLSNLYTYTTEAYQLMIASGWN
jgi:iron(III) transport system substrate-binding protein